MAPFGFLVDGGYREVAQGFDDCAGRSADRGRNLTAWRFVHERHEFVRETWHRAADTNAADVRTTADSAHPAALGNVTLYDRSPAAQLHEAGRGIVLAGELTLLVIAGAIASFVHGVSEQ